jgi:hypothetical protein
MNQLTKLKEWNQQIPQSFHVVMLGFYLLVLVGANDNPSIGQFTSDLTLESLFNPYIVGILVYLFYIITLNCFEGSKPNDIAKSTRYFLSTFSPFIGSIFIIFYLVYNLIDPSFEGILNFVAPLMSYITFKHLTDDASVHTDNWYRISREITDHAKREYGNATEIIAMIPFKPNSSKNMATYKYVIPTNETALTLKNSDNQIGGKYTFQSAAFFIRSSNEATTKTGMFHVLSEEKFSELHPTKIYSLPQKLNHVETVALSNLFSSQLFAASKSGQYNVSNFYDFKNYLARNISKENTYSAAKTIHLESKILVSHIWKPRQLRLAASLILSSLSSKGVTVEQHKVRMRELMAHQIRSVSEKNGNHATFLVHFLTLLAMSNFSNEDSNEYHCDMAALRSFANTCDIFINYMKAETKNSFSDSTGIQELLIQTQHTLEETKHKPVEGFIKYHDQILSHAREDNSERIHEVLNKTIHRLMEELQKTSYRRVLASENRFTAAQLIEIRHGIVFGTVYALSIYASYSEAE